MSLRYDGASEVVLSSDVDNFFLRNFRFAGGKGASVDIRFCGNSFGLIFCGESFSFTRPGRVEGCEVDGEGREGAVVEVGVLTGLRRLCLYFIRIIFLKCVWQ